ncbi:MAG: hybrid sensor histidine kinase/response regulator [Betaproteobacteria bacterium]
MSALQPDLPRAVLFVDDEPGACKWFARALADEFEVLTAGSVDEALALLGAQGTRIGVLITDYRMPRRDGLELLRLARAGWHGVVRILVSAYADKDVALAAVNDGHVYRVLEKPLDLDTARSVLREALAYAQARAQARGHNARAAAAVGQTLGFLAHELNTPLAVVAMNAQALRERLPAGAAAGAEVPPALARIERAARYCTDLLQGFVRAARGDAGAAEGAAFTAARLVERLLDEYPFEEPQRGWLRCTAGTDFVLPEQRDLLYLVASTLTGNALRALAGRPAPQLELAYGAAGRGGWLRCADHGPGVAPELLPRLSRERLTASGDGHGMGLVFVRRVLEACGARLELASAPGAGFTATLHFGSPQGVMP